MEVKTVPLRRLVHYTPLRYPGGKGKLAGYIKRVLEENNLIDGEYVEPYAGGAGVALELLFHEYVSVIHINDYSLPVYAFWKSILDDTEGFLRRLRDAKLSVEMWDRQKHILSRPAQHGHLDLGFATFFLNRTNCSGILNGGIIGGREQKGKWKINARFNPQELMFRIESIAKLKKRIKISNKDAIQFLRQKLEKFPENSLIYLDPPYYVKGKALYLHYYSHEDHVKISDFVRNRIKKQKWIVSYDNVPEIHKLYRGEQNITYGLGYSARDARVGAEVMFFSKSMNIPERTDIMVKV